MKCSEVKNGANVVFKVKSDIFKEKIHMDGNVIQNNKESKTMCICYLDGYQSRTETVPYEDMVAVGREDGDMMKFDNISGKSILLTAD